MSAPQAGHAAAGPAAADSKARLRLWLRLLKASHLIQAELRERLRTGYGTTLPRFDVMAALARYPDGLRMSELSGVLRVSNGNVTGIVDRLEAEGLVVRHAVEGDRRAFRVALTDEGARGFAELAAAHEGWIDGLLAGIPPRDAARLSAELDAITERLGGTK